MLGFMITYRLSWWYPGIDRRPEMWASSRLLLRFLKGKDGLSLSLHSGASLVYSVV